MNKNKKSLFIIVNVDWFFLSHRLPIAIAAKQDGYDVTVVSSDTGKSNEILANGFNFIAAPFTRSGTNIIQELLLIRFLRNLYLKHKPDIVHHVTLKPSIYGSIAAKQAGISAVINAISGLGYNFTDGRKGFKQLILSFLLKKAFKNPVLHFVFQNPDDVAIFKNVGLVKNDDHIHLIKGSGVDLKEFSYKIEPADGNINILLPARMLYDKGVIEFIKAAQNMKDKYFDKVCFNLAGDIDIQNPAGIKEAELDKLTEPPFINWIGFQKSMADVLGKHHIVVLPSYREGLPKSLIEACAIGRPIITTNAPGCRECVKDGYNGFLVPVKDHVQMAIRIGELIDDPDLRLRMGKNSRTYAEENFSIETVVHKTLEIYNQF